MGASGQPRAPLDQHVAYAFDAQTRDRNKVADQRLDTLLQMQPTSGTDLTKGAWEMAVPNGSYAVTVSVGDASYVNSTHTITVEGTRAIDAFVRRRPARSRPGRPR